MGKDIEKVRKNIASRKREKNLNKKKYADMPKAMYYSVQEEEKHGYLPFAHSSPGQAGQKQEPKTGFFLLKLIIASCLFFAVASIVQMEAGWLQKPKAWVVHNMNEDFPFAAVTSWYQDKFGSPLQLVEPDQGVEPNQAALPVSGVVSETFQTHGKGIVMTSEQPSEVVAMDEGTVVFAGKDSQTEQTIIIQHVDGSKSTYGYLSSIDVHLYEHVKPNDVIGSVKPEQGKAGSFFFAVEKDNKYIDPVEAIKVDETP
ncbi:M23 family metallopeptidase [Thalassobacillus devorans]|uniref:M23 family metallopeptidase n=1 Tax=Thalassobacillus devorans TaxID=279813 RepID=UPI00048A67EA|nr:M23 family metallopeptidase [Thalassobacillus devorans]